MYPYDIQRRIKVAEEKNSTSRMVQTEQDAMGPSKLFFSIIINYLFFCIPCIHYQTNFFQ